MRFIIVDDNENYIKEKNGVLSVTKEFNGLIIFGKRKAYKILETLTNLGIYSYKAVVLEITVQG